MERLSKQIEDCENKSKGQLGVSFYIPKEHIYVFIVTTEYQKIKFKCLIKEKETNILY